MAGPGDLAGDSWLRVSHADRDQVVATLQDAFVAGMLTRDELDTRVGRALAARTRGDLAVLTGDLPPVPAGAGRPAGTALPPVQPLRPGAVARWSGRPPRRPAAWCSRSAWWRSPATSIRVVPGRIRSTAMARPFLALAFASVITAFGLMATGVASAVEQRSARRRAAAGLPPRSAGPR